jgi:hypothetical protein
LGCPWRLTDGVSLLACNNNIFLSILLRTGLTVNYSRSDWSSQLTLAASHGIDAFALNVGLPDEWQLQQVWLFFHCVFSRQ